MESAAVLSFLLVMIVVYGIIGIFGIVMYVLQSIALYKLASRRGIKAPFLAWIPIGNMYTFGALADEVNARTSAKQSNWRKILLAVHAIGSVGYIITYIVYTVINVLSYANSDLYLLALIVALVMLVFSLTMFASTILHYICIYKIFMDTEPDRGVIYTVVSILVPLGEPICLFLIRNSGYDAHATVFEPTDYNYVQPE